MAQALGFKEILYHTRNPVPSSSYPSSSSSGKVVEAKHVSLDRLYAESDAIVITCPLTPETRGMVNDAAFERMKDGMVLVNVARGPIIDDDALVRALGSGKGKSRLD